MGPSYLSHTRVAGSPGSARCKARDSPIGSRGFGSRVRDSTVRSKAVTCHKAGERGAVLRDGIRDQIKRIGGRRSGARIRPSAIVAYDRW